MVADYRFLFSTLRAEQVVAEVSLYGVYMSLGLNGNGGQFDGTFQLDQTGKRNEDLIAATIPGSTYVVCERNGIPIGAWFIWSRVYSAQSKTLQLHGQAFDSYPKKARILTDTSFVGVEQMEIFKSLWTQMQSVYGRNVNVNVPSGTFPTLVPKNLEVLATDFRYYSEAMSSLADSSNGFDWYVAVTKDGVNYRKDLRLGYPTLGTPSGALAQTIFEYPGNVTQYYMTESMSDAGTNILVLGAGSGSDMITAEYANTDLLDGGMARWDLDIARKDVENQALLNTVTQSLGVAHRAPGTTIKLTAKGDNVPEIGSYNLGDATSVIIKDARNPFGYTRTSRLIMWEVRPPTSERVEEADLTFEGDEI